MGVLSVTNQGPQAPELLPARTPPTRDGPEIALNEALSKAGANSKPEKVEKPDRRNEAALAEPRPRRAGTHLRVDPATKRIVTQIIDEMKQVVKQIPPEELLKIVARTRESYARMFDESI